MKNYTNLFSRAILCSLLFCQSIFAHAQTADYNIGSDDSNFVGVVVRPLSDGSSIIAGYVYSDWPGVMIDAQMLLLHVRNNTILWAKKWGASNVNNFIQDMIIARNGDIIVAGADGLTISGSVLSPCIYRFDHNGNFLNEEDRFSANLAPPYANAFFHGVCELQDGRIIAVGTYMYQGKEQGMVVTYSSSLTFIYHDILSTGMSLHKHTFTSVVPDLSDPAGNKVLICGSDSDGTAFKASLLSYTPPASHTMGTFNWINLYNIQDGSKTNSRFTQIYYAYQDPTNHNNDRLLLSGILSSDCCGVNNSEQFSFSSNDSGISNIKAFGFDNGKQFTNTSKIYPSYYNNINDDFEVYITENPDAAANDPVLNADKAIKEGRISDIYSLNAASINYSRANAAGEHSMLDLQQRLFSGVPLTYTVGAIVYTGGHSWIDYSMSNPYYNKSTIKYVKAPECEHTDEYLAIHHPLNVSRSTVPFNNGKLNIYGGSWVYPENITLKVDSICGTVDTLCGDMNVTIVRNQVQGEDSCSFTVKGVVHPNYGWICESFAWHIGGSIINHVGTNIDSVTVHITNSTATTIMVDVLLQDSFGHECNIVKQMQLSCNNPPCDSNVISSITVGTAIPQADHSCYLVVTATAGLAYGWTVTGWTTVSSISGIQYIPTSNTTGYLYENLANLGFDIVTITMHLVDSNGNIFDITKTVAITCNDGDASIFVQPCSANEIVNVVASPAFPGGGSDCNLNISASVNLGYGWSVTGWTWQGPTTQNTTTTSTSDTYWLGSMYNMTATIITITVHLIDINGNPCDITKSVVISCNSGSGIVMKHPGGNNVTVNHGIVNVQAIQPVIRIYPNPTDGAINISSTLHDINNVEVFDLSGKILESYRFDHVNEAHISIEAYAAGTYILKVNNYLKQIVNKIR